MLRLKRRNVLIGHLVRVPMNLAYKNFELSWNVLSSGNRIPNCGIAFPSTVQHSIENRVAQSRVRIRNHAAFLPE